MPSQHVPTFERKLAPILRESPRKLDFYETHMELCNGVALDFFIVASGILPYLDRKDDFLPFSLTNRNWNNLAKLARATTPASAKDVRIAIEVGLYDNDNTEFDGEYKLYHKGISEKTMTLYCHNIMSNRPTEYLSLHSSTGTKPTNYSFAPTGGSCRGKSIKTTFRKLRIDPWSLTVKTDDFTFADTLGGPLHQSYWNGVRTIELRTVPYATARDSMGHGYWRSSIDDPDEIEIKRNEAGLLYLENHTLGLAMVDLRGTGFSIFDNAFDDVDDKRSAFSAMGCSPFGRICFKETVTSKAGNDISNLKQTDQKEYHQWIHLSGGGYAGRVVPRRDRTYDEQAQGGNFDDEGNNGGWVLPLSLIPKDFVEKTADDTKWQVRSAPIV